MQNQEWIFLANEVAASHATENAATGPLQLPQTCRHYWQQRLHHISWEQSLNSSKAGATLFILEKYRLSTRGRSLLYGRHRLECGIPNLTITQVMKNLGYEPVGSIHSVEKLGQSKRSAFCPRFRDRQFFCLPSMQISSLQWSSVAYVHQLCGQMKSRSSSFFHVNFNLSKLATILYLMVTA